MSRRSLETRIVAAAEEALARQKFVTPVDVCLGLGWLQPGNVRDWERGRIDNLEEFLPVHDERMVEPIVQLRRWAKGKGLTQTEADYLAATRDRRPLRFTEAIASHTAMRGSGRVGRSAAGRSLDEQAVTLAVVASIRHEGTEYDDLLMSGVARQDARDQVRDAIDQVLASWSG